MPVGPTAKMAVLRSRDHSAVVARGDLRLAGRTGYDRSQGRVDDRDLCAYSDDLVKLNHVFGPHPHTTITGR